MKVIAVPYFPALPVLPKKYNYERWIITYSMDIVFHVLWAAVVNNKDDSRNI